MSLIKAFIAIAQLAQIILFSVGMQNAIAEENTSPEQRGAAIFYGKVDLSGRLTGHDDNLPNSAIRCTNCHEELSTTPSTIQTPNTTPKATTFAQPLTSQHLKTPQTRRGGPPSIFNAERLCTLLRTGIDPANIIISTTMPRYDLTDAECEDLWIFLETK